MKTKSKSTVKVSTRPASKTATKAKSVEQSRSKIVTKAVKKLVKKSSIKKVVTKPTAAKRVLVKPKAPVLTTKKVVLKKKATTPIKKVVLLKKPQDPISLPVADAPVKENKVQLRIPGKKRKLAEVIDIKQTYVTCLNCGRVHFQLPRFEAQVEVDNFNEFFDKSKPDIQELFGNAHAKIETYEKCFGCGNDHKFFRETEEGDAPSGVTLTPIIDRFE